MQDLKQPNTTSRDASALRVLFPAPGQVTLESFPLPEPGPNQVRVRTRWSLISTGTETIVLHRRFAPGSHWEGYAVFPFRPGYNTMGEIQALGPGTTAPAIGTRVLLRGGHASHLVVGADIVYPVPEGIDERAACWFGMAKIAFMGARKAEYRLGDDVLVIGAGPIGQMTVRWAAAAGARRISVVDPSAARLPLAFAGGATATFATGIAAALPALTAHHDGQLPRVVIDTTGNPNVLSDALRAVRSHGRVVLLGDSGPLGDGHTMTNDLLVRGVQLVGAHDIHDDAEWNDRTVTGLFLELGARGRFPLDGLATDTFAPADCAAAYIAADARRGETMGIYFDWRGGVR